MAELEKEIQETEVEETVEAAVETPEENPWEKKYNEEHDLRMRLAAEYDNFRKRSDFCIFQFQKNSIPFFTPLNKNYNVYLKQYIYSPKSSTLYTSGLTNFIKILENSCIHRFRLLNYFFAHFSLFFPE